MLRTGWLVVERVAKLSKTSKTLQFVGAGSAVGATGYALLDPREKILLRSMAGSSVRFVRSFAIGLTISVDYWIAPIMGHEDEAIHKRAADRLVNGCMQNGGLYVKLGQGLAALNHILPKEYVVSLTALQDKCLTRDDNELENIFLQDFGRPPEQVFETIEHEPVAAASLAQVYKATMADGKNVAVKVQYIDLQDRFHADIKTVDFLLKIISIMHPKFNFHWVLDELKETLAQELDFKNEGTNAERCAEDLKAYRYAYIPKVFWDYSTKRILTTEWIDGIKINDKEALKKEGLSLADVDCKLITIMAEQVFHTGFVHADPHPGNVFIRKANDGKAQIVLLDHGLYERVPQETRHSLCNFWEAMILRDENRMRLHARELNVDDHYLLGELLTQAPVFVGNVNLNKPSNMTADEYMVQQAQMRFDRVMGALKSMPKNMMLVIRNLNTVRSIAREHGDPVDRYRVMARMAVRGKYRNARSSLRGGFRAALNRVRFETQLWSQSFVLWLFGLYLKILRLLGHRIDEVIDSL